MQDKKKVLSLFSCCGGLDMGLEGGFECFERQVNEKRHPDWIAEHLDGGKVVLCENGFETVFANDIDPNAKKTWTRYFQEKHAKNDAVYHLGSIVDFVKRAKDPDDEFEFPQADVVTGGFPCLVGDTLILTENGYMPLDSVKEGMKVVGHDGELHVVERWLDQGVKETYKLRGSGFDEIIATGNHQFYCRAKETGDLEWHDLDFLCASHSDGTPNYKHYYLGTPVLSPKEILPKWSGVKTAINQDQNFYDPENNYIWYKINGIEQYGSHHVYDITVQGSHSFIANGCATHNCCDFSVSGKRQGFNSTKSDTEANIDAPTPENRGMLYYWMKEVIDLVEPKMFIAENVKGLTNLGDAQQVIEEDFRNTGECGYVVIPARVLHSADYGVAQNRERVIFFGFNKKHLTDAAIEALTAEAMDGAYDPYPAPTHDYTHKGIPDDAVPFFCVREALAGLAEPGEEADDPSQKAYSRCKFMGDHCQGQSEVKLDGVGPTIRSKHHGNIEFRRRSAEHGGTHAGELESGLEERRLSVRECARIQSFPDDYDFVIDASMADKDGQVSSSAAYVLVGNAVPPVLAYNIARNIDGKWKRWFC